VLLNDGHGKLDLWGYAPTGRGPSVAFVFAVDEDRFPDVVVGTDESGFSVQWNRTSPARLTDAVRTLNYLFQGGEPPAAPFPECGMAVTPSELKCSVNGGCP